MKSYEQSLTDEWIKKFKEFNEHWRFLVDVLKKQLNHLNRKNEHLQQENQRLREQISWYQRVLFHLQQKEIK